LELIIYFKGNVFISYHIRDECVESITLGKGQATIFFDENNCCLHQTFRDFPPKRIMFGLTSRGKEDSLKVYPMKMKLETGEVIKIITLTIIADNISAMIG